eukprot:905984-Pleurochrysis_carterae.AAC.3
MLFLPLPQNAVLPADTSESWCTRTNKMITSVRVARLSSFAKTRASMCFLEALALQSLQADGVPTRRACGDDMRERLAHM